MSNKMFVMQFLQVMSYAGGGSQVEDTLLCFGGVIMFPGDPYMKGLAVR